MVFWEVRRIYVFADDSAQNVFWRILPLVLYDFLRFVVHVFVIFVFSTRSSDTISRVLQCFQHCCKFSERVLKNLARSRRNTFLLRSVCISCVLLLPRPDLLVFYSVLGGRAYLRIL